MPATPSRLADSSSASSRRCAPRSSCAFLGAAALLRHRQTHRLLPLLDQAPLALLKLPGELAVAYLAHDLRIARLVT